MFHSTVIESLANRLNSRDFQYTLHSLGALSSLMLERGYGRNTVHQHDLECLLNCTIEKSFPLPLLQITVNGIEKTVTIGGQKFHTPETEPGIHLTWRPNALWNVVTKDEAGDYHLIASSDAYQIPRGVLTVPFNYKEYETSPGAVKQDNLLVSRGQVIWEIRTWADVAKIMTADTYFEMGISRINNEVKEETPLLLITEDDLKTSFVDVATLEERGLAIGPYGNSVLELVDRLIKVEGETVKVELDEDQMAIMAKIHKELDIDGLVDQLKQLPVKKRTRAQVRGIMAAFLAQDK